MKKLKRTKTKIVATLGPASNTYETIKKLAESGASVFRLNTSHETPEDHARRIKLVRQVAKDLSLYLGILVDLQGPKIRVGMIENPIEIKAGDIVKLRHTSEYKDGIIPVDYEGIANDVTVGERILLDDGNVGLEVTEINGDVVTAKVIYGKEIKKRKGINIPGTQAGLPSITERDKEYIKFAVEQDADFLAMSFVRSAQDIKVAKDCLKELNADIPIIAKIEKPQAVTNLTEILKESYGVMVARGDLGIEMSPEQVPIAQKKIVKKAAEMRKVCIVATQMLESMITHPIPTRAEASDVANAILDGADAVMLSGETASGEYPVRAVQMMCSISKNVESGGFRPKMLDIAVSPDYQITPQAIAAAAVKMAYDLKAKAILSFTHTGYTPRLISELKSQIPVIALSDQISTCRRLNLSWNVYTYEFYNDGSLDKELLAKIDEFLYEKTDFKKDDRIICVGSIPNLITGRTNFVRVHRIGA